MVKGSQLLFLILFHSSLLFGQKIEISDIVIDGNKITKEAIILRELPFSKGGQIDSTDLGALIALAEQNLRNTDLFNEIMVTAIPGFKNDLLILIEVKELWYIFPSIIFRLADPNFNIWWKTKDLSRVNYGLSYLQKNFRGRKERLSIKAQFGYSKQFTLSYQIPGVNKERTLGLLFYGNFRQYAEVNVGTINNDRVFYNDGSGKTKEIVQFGLGFDHRPGFNLLQRLYLGTNSISMSDSLFMSHTDHLNGKDHLSFFELSYLIRHQKVDYFAYPQEGYTWFFESQLKGIGARSQDMFANLFFQFTIHNKMSERWTVQNGFKSKYSFYKELPYALQRGLGYSDTQVRGYGYYIVDGQAYGLLRNNLKYNIIKPSQLTLPIRNEKINTLKYAFYLNGFIDLGYVKDDLYSTNNFLDNKLLVGTGLGLDFVTVFNRVYRLEYAFNNINEHGLFLQYKKSI